MRISKFSLTALGLPGRLTIMVLPLEPITARERQAVGTILIDSYITYMTRGSALFSMTSRVASGVLSLSKNPVPPEVKIRLQSSISSKASLIFSLVSFTITCFEIPKKLG